jgi:ATP-dependent HslUV protease ATP-binding subunit HslU
MSTMTPREIVHELDATSSARTPPSAPSPSRCATAGGACSCPKPLRDEVTPKNILMIGPTGCRQDRDRRRLARLANAPFLKVEATKFTEVGYVGRDVDTIIRDLVDVPLKMTREREMPRCAIAPRKPPRNASWMRCCRPAVPRNGSRPSSGKRDSATREKFRKMLREGKLDEREIEIELSNAPMGVDIMAPPGMEEMSNQLQGLFQNLGHGTHHRKLKVARGAEALVRTKRPPT